MSPFRNNGPGESQCDYLGNDECDESHTAQRRRCTLCRLEKEWQVVSVLLSVSIDVSRDLGMCRKSTHDVHYHAETPENHRTHGDGSFAQHPEGDKGEVTLPP